MYQQQRIQEKKKIRTNSSDEPLASNEVIQSKPSNKTTIQVRTTIDNKDKENDEATDGEETEDDEATDGEETDDEDMDGEGTKEDDDVDDDSERPTGIQFMSQLNECGESVEKIKNLQHDTKSQLFNAQQTLIEEVGKSEEQKSETFVSNLRFEARTYARRVNTIETTEAQNIT